MWAQLNNYDNDKISYLYKCVFIFYFLSVWKDTYEFYKPGAADVDIYKALVWSQRLTRGNEHQPFWCGAHAKLSLITTCARNCFCHRNLPSGIKTRIPTQDQLKTSSTELSARINAPEVTSKMLKSQNCVVESLNYNLSEYSFFKIVYGIFLFIHRYYFF